MALENVHSLPSDPQLISAIFTKDATAKATYIQVMMDIEKGRL